MLRRTPMKRSWWNRKPRKPSLRPRSPRRAAQDRRDAAGLEAFALEHDRCWCCGTRGDFANELQIHHAVGRHGDGRHARCSLIRLCRDCHKTFTDNRHRRHGFNAKASGVLVCLALKQLHDRAYYDREAVLALWGKDSGYISESDVLNEVRDMRTRNF